MLLARRVLIVEDESLIAMEIVDIVEGAGGRVVGPVRSNRDALQLIDTEGADLAVLDLNLADGDATPVFERLTAAGVPVLVCTAGILPRAIRTLAPDVPVHRKPIDARRFVATLAGLGASVAA